MRRSLIEQTKCRWREFKREPSALFWVVFMPTLWIVALGLAFSSPKPEKFAIAYIKPKDSSLNQKSLDDLSASPSFKIVTLGKKDALKRIKLGEFVLGVTIKNGHAVYTYDPSQPASLRARHLANDIIQKSAGRRDPVLIKDKEMHGQGNRYVDFLVPGVLALSIMTSSLFGIGMTIVANRRDRLLKRYLATPMPPRDYLLSHMIGRLQVLTFEFVAVWIVARLFFKVQVEGNIFAYFAFSALGAAAFTAIALTCAARTKSLPFIAGITNLISLSMMLLSGVFFSKANFPDWILPALNLLPLTALADGLRSIALSGASLSDIAPNALVLAFYAIGAGLIARARFRWQ